MDLFIITFSGTEPELKSVFFPLIELDDDYVIGLVDFQSYNSIKIPLNTLSYYKVEKISLPNGDILINDLNWLLDSKLEVKIRKNEELKQNEALINTKVKLLFKGLIPKLNKLINTKLTIARN